MFIYHRVGIDLYGSNVIFGFAGSAAEYLSLDEANRLIADLTKAVRAIEGRRKANSEGGAK